jgi:hypothetical protein
LIKVKLGYSPDHLDALMLTFAAPVMKTAPHGKPKFTASYDPLNSDYIEAN